MKESNSEHVRTVFFHPYFPEDKDFQLSDEYDNENYTLNINKETGIPTYIMGIVTCEQRVISVIVASPASPEDTAVDVDGLRFLALDEVALSTLKKLLHLCICKILY